MGKVTVLQDLLNQMFWKVNKIMSFYNE